MANEQKVKGTENVTIEFLEKTPYFEKGAKVTVHRVQADKFIESKKAKEVKEAK